MTTAPRTVILPAPLDDAMRKDLEPSYPNEGCGIMIGKVAGSVATLTRIVPASNINSARGRDRFEIDPMLYYRTERELAGGEQVIGFYHSHPDCPAVASETDRQFALNWPGFVWVIYRVDEGHATGVRAWIVDDGSGQFTEMEVAH